MDIKGPGAVSVINRNQLTAFATTVPSKGEFDTHLADTTNPHSVTLAQVGAAPLVHTHSIQQVTDLQDKLDDKYSKVTGGPATNNIVIFETGGLLKDSGITTDDIVGTPDETGQSFKSLTNVGIKKSSFWSYVNMNPIVMTEDQIIPTGASASVVSGFTINDGVTLTVPDGSVLSVV